jgi:hypothetical protein
LIGKKQERCVTGLTLVKAEEMKAALLLMKELLARESVLFIQTLIRIWRTHASILPNVHSLFRIRAGTAGET